MRLIAFITEGIQIRQILDHIGVDRRNPHTTMRSTSASTGDRSKRRFRLAAGVPCVWRTRRTAIHSHGRGFLAATLPGNALSRANRDSLRGSGADSECDTWLYAVEFPIRYPYPFYARASIAS